MFEIRQFIEKRHSQLYPSLSMVIRLKQVPVSIHRDREAAVAGEGLYRLGFQIGLNPARYREMP
jgi:hypothetical protein